MSKSNDILSSIGGIYILYKLRWVILVGIIVFGVIIFSVKGDLDKEYQQYGYTGFSDKIEYDEWTHEIIPKNGIFSLGSSPKFQSRNPAILTPDVTQIILSSSLSK